MSKSKSKSLLSKSEEKATMSSERAIISYHKSAGWLVLVNIRCFEGALDDILQVTGWVITEADGRRATEPVITMGGVEVLLRELLAYMNRDCVESHELFPPGAEITPDDHVRVASLAQEAYNERRLRWFSAQRAEECSGMVQ
jgi:hypothetical protein